MPGLSSNFAALADPTRFRIIEMLASRELSAGEIASKFDVSQPAISQHLKILREARLVCVRVEAQSRIYQIDSAGFKEIDQWLENIRRFWSRKLDLLEKQLRKERKRP